MLSGEERLKMMMIMISIHLTWTLSMANSAFSVMCCSRRPGVQIIMLQELMRFHSYFRSFPPAGTETIIFTHSHQLDIEEEDDYEGNH